MNSIDYKLTVPDGFDIEQPFFVDQLYGASSAFFSLRQGDKQFIGLIEKHVAPPTREFGQADAKRNPIGFQSPDADDSLSLAHA